MSEFTYQEYTRRNLPHWHPPGATLFVTFRLAGTIPQPVARQWKAQKRWLEEEAKRMGNLKLKSESPEIVAHEQRLRAFRREWFAKVEDILHQEESGPTWLKDEQIAQIVAEALHYRDSREYRLDAYCLMSNHVHAVFAPFLSTGELCEESRPEGIRFTSQNPPLAAIMKSLKGYTARQANQALGRQGAFWEDESYDHVVRHAAEFERIIKYVLDNPVKAKLVKDWRQWKWNYRREDVPQTVSLRRFSSL